MDHIFPCTPQGGNISQLYPTCYSTRVYIGGIYMLHIRVHTFKLIKRPTSMIFQSNPTSLKDLEHALQSIFPLLGKFLACIYVQV